MLIIDYLMPSFFRQTSEDIQLVCNHIVFDELHKVLLNHIAFIFRFKCSYFYISLSCARFRLPATIMVSPVASPSYSLLRGFTTHESLFSATICT